MHSLFLLVDFLEVDAHLDTCRINQNQLLENYRIMADILRHEIDFLNPPCLESTAIEKKGLEYLVSNCVISMQSDEAQSEEQQKAKKIALHMDLEFEEEDENLLMPDCEIYLSVNLDNALKKKWVTSIATSLLGIY